ncbi:MAG: ABC transporter ATP-binding protein [Bradymonadaceae bacterium]|nr:ABC transporter ATP-binding protein [Lujinxingiaceae bacterium]
MQPAAPSEIPFSIEPSVRRARLWGYFVRYKGLFFAGAVFLFLTNMLALAIPAYLGQAIQLMRDAAGASGEGFSAVRSQVVHAAVVIIFLAIASGFCRIFSRTTIFNAGRHIEFDIRNEVYARLAKLDPRFYARMSTGDVTSRVTNDVTYVRLLYAIAFLHIINAAIAYTIAIQKMVALDWALTLWCLASYPLLLLGVRYVIRALFNQTKVVQAQLSAMSTRVQENLAGVNVVKSYVLEGREIAGFARANEDYYHKNMVLARIRGMLDSLVVMMATVGTLVVLLIGSRKVIENTMTLGQFVEFNAYVVAIAFPTIAMGWVFSVWHRGLAGFERVCEILYHEPDIKQADDARTLPPIDGELARGHVRFENVQFGYTDKRVLHDINIDIPAGSTVAFVGRTGSGKSTLVKLIARFYDPNEGQITIDGVPLPKLALRETRSQIGFVPQEPFLFSMTIGQNVRFGLDALEFDDSVAREAPTRALLPGGEPDDGRPLTQDERIVQAITVAGLGLDIDSFPQGLETLVGERGVTLSGGQKQRVTIARALLVDPRILILDDALSSVDTQTESIILDHLDHLMKGRTSILLTHRFNALARVDCIYVLDEGRVVESGTHWDLIEQGGVYAAMLERQKLREQLES